MTDIARLAIEVDPKQLQAAINQLEKLSVASAKAEVAAKKLEKTEASAALAIANANRQAATQAAQAAAANKTMSVSQKQAAAEGRRQAEAAYQAAKGIDLQAAASLKAAQAALQQSEAAQKLIQSNQGVEDSAQSAAAAQDRSMRNMGRLAGQQQANMANVAAQFQDIGVTAAMGMSPLMIGLQQGAQLTGVWGSVAGTTSQKLKTFAMSIGAVLSPMSLLIIGLTAGLAYLIQWGVEAFTTSNEVKSLSDATGALSSMQSALGEMFDLTSGKIQNNTELVRLNTLQTILNAKAKAAQLAAESQAVLGGIGGWGKGAGPGQGYGWWISGEENKQRQQNITMLKGLALSVKQGQTSAEEAVKIAGQLSYKGTGYTVEQIQNAFIAGGMSKEIDKLAEGAMKGFESGQLGAEFLKPEKGRTPRAKKPEETEAEKFAKMMKESKATLTVLGQEYELLNLVGEARYENAATFEMENKALELGIDLKKEDRQARIESMAAEIAAQQIKNDTLKYYLDEEKALKAAGLELKIKQKTIGMTAAETELYAYKQKLLNDEIERGIKLSPKEKQSLIATKAELIAQNEELNKYKQAMDNAKSATRDFLGTMKDGLLSGKSFWETWTNAVLGMIDRVINKLLDDLVNAIFKANQASGGGSIFDLIGKAFGAVGPSYGGDTANLEANFDKTFGYANGGVFTNSVVHKPTHFFAKGGTPGVMGEAGPEAIMPLQRGPDGALGVQMYGGGTNAEPTVVQVIPSEYFDVVVDQRAAKVAGPMVVQGAMVANKVSENTTARQSRRRLR